MALNTNKPLKLYYSIKEVAQMLNVSESLLRYWETEFPQIRPKTLSNKVRQYTDKDIEQIKVIYNLVKVRGFKLAAARKMLSQNKNGADKSAEVLSSLISVRDELKTLKKQLDGLV
jgi:DNA-binding transcriptional MerR regulator